jgi:hypothetical protein
VGLSFFGWTTPKDHTAESATMLFPRQTKTLNRSCTKRKRVKLPILQHPVESVPVGTRRIGDLRRELWLPRNCLKTATHCEFATKKEHTTAEEDETHNTSRHYPFIHSFPPTSPGRPQLGISRQSLLLLSSPAGLKTLTPHSFACFIALRLSGRATRC